ncbi:mucin-1-like [Felis catus]|uniref:mucin-1-like n=1 Tax=Felis catus TaxID=9685 RepID=UPI001D1A0BC8|nr:mucin-1-like [Felis catus]
MGRGCGARRESGRELRGSGRSAPRRPPAARPGREEGEEEGRVAPSPAPRPRLPRRARAASSPGSGPRERPGTGRAAGCNTVPVRAPARRPPGSPVPGPLSAPSARRARTCAAGDGWEAVGAPPGLPRGRGPRSTLRKLVFLRSAPRAGYIVLLRWTGEVATDLPPLASGTPAAATSGRDREGDQLRLLEKSITQIYLGYKAEQELLLEGQRRGGLRAWASRRLCHPPFPGTHTQTSPGLRNCGLRKDNN